jgi:hypothetical protein
MEGNSSTSQRQEALQGQEQPPIPLVAANNRDLARNAYVTQQLPFGVRSRWSATIPRTPMQHNESSGLRIRDGEGKGISRMLTVAVEADVHHGCCSSPSCLAFASAAAASVVESLRGGVRRGNGAFICCPKTLAGREY